MTFSVVAIGTLPLSYQWQHNGTNLLDDVRISGSQLPILTIEQVQAGDAGDYWLVLTNAFGAVTSSTARLTVPPNQGEVRFHTPAIAAALIWTNNLPDGWTPDLSGTNAGTAAGWISGPRGTYMFALFFAPTTVATVEEGTPWTDPNWAFTGNYATNVTSGRINGNYNPDDSVTIPGYAPGSSASLMVIGWNTAVGGATLDSFETAWNQHAAGLYYGCSSVAHIQLGNGVSIPNVNIFGLSAGQIGGFVMSPGADAPTVAVSPQTQTAELDSTVDFTADATGFPPLSFQWFFDITNAITSATNSVLHLVNVQFSQAGAYSVVVTNAFGAVTSSPVMLDVVGVAPTILSPPVSRTAAVGGTVNFSVSAAGSLPLSYQWFFNLTNTISGAINSVLQLTNVQFSQVGAYAVVVTNAFGAVTSSPATLNVVFPMVVTNCTEEDLRAAVAEGGTVTFACDGTITLSSTITIDTDTVLDGSGHQVTISGNNACRVFFVIGNVNFTLIDLTIAHGLGTNGNYGGGIYNDGTVNATNCIFFNNCAYGFSAGGYGFGGAIYNMGIFTASQCSFLQNSAGGGVGTCFPVGPSFHPWGNGRSGGPGGTGGGGAICNLGTLEMDRSLFASNTASGGNGGTGEGAWAGEGMPYISPGGAGGNGGCGAGGVLFNVGTADLANCTFAWNQSVGGNGGEGGEPASFYWEGRTYQAPGGGSGSDGYGLGGIYNTNGTFNLINCTLAFNSSSNGSVAGGGIVTAGLGRLINTLLASNTPTNCSGVITDAGHNLSSDGSCAFSNSGSLNNTDPLLGPLADNGGPTLTMALLPGSPAIDAGDTAAAPPTDQRGFPRPVGSAADIGAYECSPPVIAALEPSQTTEMGDTLDLWASVSDPAPLCYQWFCNGNAIADCTNSVLCLSGVQLTNVGTYSVIVSNIFGAVTSSPAILNVIPMVERRGVPAINLMGETGSSLNVEFTGALDSPANWLPLDTVSLTSTTQYYFDLTSPLPSQRFYRAWQLGTPSVVSSLSLPGMVPAITLTGTVGSSVRVDCINQFGPTDAWVTLDTVTLTNTSQLYFDVSAIGQPARLWRIVPVP